MEEVSRFSAKIGLAVAFGAVVLTMASPARADWCGGVGERPCRVDERFPSCDVNLVEQNGACVRPACGAEGQRQCMIQERTRFDPVMIAQVHVPCDQDLKLDLLKGQCFHPPVCGRENQAACTVFVRVPSCDANFVEKAGKCVHPACGRLGEAACTVVVRLPSCDSNLLEREGQCVRAGTAPVEHAAAPVIPKPPPPPAPPPPPNSKAAPAPAPPPAPTVKPAQPPPAKKKASPPPPPPPR
jgi:hypothetical protein